MWPPTCSRAETGCVPSDAVRALRTILLATTAVAVSACGVTGTAATVGDQTITIASIQNEIIDFSESFD